MAKQSSLPWEEARDSEAFESAARFKESQAVMASPVREIGNSEPKRLTVKPVYARLNLEDLKCFEGVEKQFHYWGVLFRNAIALQPSNPAYPPRSGTTVLMGAPDSGWIEAIFPKPVCFVCCYVTSSQRTIMSAYDAQDNLLLRSEMPGANLAGSSSEILPNTQLSIQSPNISRITLSAFDGQLIVDDFSFGF